MKVYGFDFTSNPTKSKRLTLAECALSVSVLTVENLIPLDSKSSGDFTPFENWLNGIGAWEKEDCWIAGLDFPFGMPIEAIEHFEWLSGESSEQSWEEYLRNLYQADDPEQFRMLIEGWRHSTRKSKNKKKTPIRVRKQRLTDKLAISGSPMNYFPPPVCPMFFQGVQRLKDCPKDISVVPVRKVPLAKKTIIEAYPRLVANVFIGRRASYKDKSKKKDDNKERQKELRLQDEAAKKECRRRIIDGVASEQMQKHYGFRLAFSPTLADKCLDDTDGDKLDSVLSAVQAAWALNAPNQGMPGFSLKVLIDQIQLEGWIADPFVLQRLADGDS
jgi:hypothetical protein